MRWFWGLLALAVVATAVLLVVRRAPAPAASTTSGVPAAAPVSSRGDTTNGAAASKADAGLAPAKPTVAPPPIASVPQADTVRPVVTPPASAGVPIKPTDPAAAAPMPSPEPKRAPAAVPEPPAPKLPEKAVPAPAEAPRPGPALAPTTGGLTPPQTAPQPPDASPPPVAAGADPKQFVGPPSPADAAALVLKQGLDDVLGLGDAGATKHEPESAVIGEHKATSGSAAGPATAAAATAKAKLTPRDDGTTLVDDRFVMKGTGTHDDPYVITWEMLVSAQETYQPRLGRKIIPDRLKMIDGKWVRIAGYIAFPIMAQSQDEMLMMLNQWDGCCIGVPPTPYDAIEVKLKVPARGDERLRVSGSITGILRVDPYLVKDWLVSLYLMDDGELKVESSGAKRDPVAAPGHKPPQ